MNTSLKAGFWNSSSPVDQAKINRRKLWKYDPLLWNVLAQVMDLGNPVLLSHSNRVADLAALIARRLGLTEEQVELIIRASLFHDIGKLALSQTILSKPGPLTPSEYGSVKVHPDLGAALLQECTDSHSLIPIVRHHHEFFDGRGYPDRICGEGIELEARIISVADAVDVMSSDQPYRRALPHRQIIRELQRCSGTQFDPCVVEQTTQVLQEMG